MASSSDFRLRALEPEDLDLLYEVENDTSLWQHSATNVPYSRYLLRQYIAEAKNDLYADGQVRLVAEADGHAVGLCDLSNFDPQHQRAEIGLVLFSHCQGHGYGRLAVSALEAYARRLMLHQIYAVIADDNLPAARLFEHSGFLPSAHLSDWIRRPDRFVSVTIWQRIFAE